MLEKLFRLDENRTTVRIEVVAGLARVRALCDGKTVADHERIWAWHQTITDPAHVEAAQALRRERITIVRPVTDTDVQIRPLADYDAALGVDGGAA